VKEPATVDKLCTASDTSRFAFFAISISFDPYGSLIPRGQPSPSGRTECSRSLLTKRIHGLILDRFNHNPGLALTIQEATT